MKKSTRLFFQGPELAHSSPLCPEALCYCSPVFFKILSSEGPGRFQIRIISQWPDSVETTPSRRFCVSHKWRLLDMKPMELLKAVPKPVHFLSAGIIRPLFQDGRGEPHFMYRWYLRWYLCTKDFLHSTELSSPSHDVNMGCLEHSTSSDSSKGKHYQLSAF